MKYPEELVNRILCGDCVKVMKSIPNGVVDLTVTSPPYDKLRDYKGFTFNFEEIAKELYRITVPGGVVVWIIGDATIKGSETGSSFRQALSFIDIGFNLHDTMIYQKSGFSNPSSNRYHQIFEYMFVLSKGKPKTFNPIKDKRNKTQYDFSKKRRQKDGTISHKEDKSRIKVSEFGMRFNVWHYLTGRGHSAQDDIAYEHPAIFPEKLAEDHIVSWSNEGDLVLDPMCGCYDKDTEIFTVDGWKNFKDLTPNDLVGTLDENEYLRFERPKRIINYHYKGNMIHFTNYHFDLLVTPDHNVYTLPRYKEHWELRKASDVKLYGKFKSVIKWGGKDLDFICINPEVCPHKRSRHVSYQTYSRNEIRYCFDCEKRYTVSNQSKSIQVKYPADMFLKFLGFYLAEGWVGFNDTSIYISQKKIVPRQFIEHVFDHLQLSFSYDNRRNKYRLNDKKLNAYLRQFGHLANRKRIHNDIKQLSTKLLECLLEGLIMGDGVKRKNGFRYWTSSPQLANDVQEIALKCGYTVQLKKRTRDKINYIRGRKVEPKSDEYCISGSRVRGTPKISNIKRVPYNDKVYCVEVNPPHLLLIRRGGKCSISGNSGTTPKMALKLNRRFIGIDISEDYCEIAKKRIEKVINDQKEAEKQKPLSDFV